MLFLVTQSFVQPFRSIYWTCPLDTGDTAIKNKENKISSFYETYIPLSEPENKTPNVYILQRKTENNIY